MAVTFSIWWDSFAVLFSALALLYLRHRQRLRNRGLYPPGPPPRFLIGNMLDFPKKDAYREYAKMGEAYGDVVHLEAFGQHVVVLNSKEAATELLDRRSKIYSDRPYNVMLDMSDLSDWSLAFLHYNDGWRIKRRLGQKYFRPIAVVAYRDAQGKRAKEMLRNMLESPHLFNQHVRTQAGSAIMDILYDYEVTGHDDQFIELADRLSRLVGDDLVYPGHDIFNTMPWFKKVVPLLSRLTKAVEVTRSVGLETRALPFTKVEDRIKKGEALHSIAAKMLVEQPGERNEIMNLMASLYVGAADTTPSLATALFFVLGAYPDVQKAAQDEIDRVVGSDRLPEINDRVELPYVEALYRELTRWATVLPFTVPRVASEDDIYNGYLIPKGSVIMPNVWAINHDDRRWPNPHKFDPRRHLSSGKLKETAPTAESHLFGFGRRKCPGRFMADVTVWMTTVNILHSFEVSFPTNSKYMSMENPEIDYIEGIVHHPSPFPCKIIPRSEKHRELILATSEVQ